LLPYLPASASEPLALLSAAARAAFLLNSGKEGKVNVKLFRLDAL
jgi:hypothetical protein